MVDLVLISPVVHDLTLNLPPELAKRGLTALRVAKNVDGERLASAAEIARLNGQVAVLMRESSELRLKLHEATLRLSEFIRDDGVDA